jgi:hypothetical protein
MRLERKAKGWLVAQGMNATLATGILWVVRIALLGFVLYGAFWVALLLAFAYTGAWMARNTDVNSEDNYLSITNKGSYSFMTLDELRDTPGYDPNFYNDTDHEMYEDD